MMFMIVYVVMILIHFNELVHNPYYRYLQLIIRCAIKKKLIRRPVKIQIHSTHCHRNHFRYSVLSRVCVCVFVLLACVHCYLSATQRLLFCLSFQISCMLRVLFVLVCARKHFANTAHSPVCVE
jgi:hypothetical protein